MRKKTITKKVTEYTEECTHCGKIIRGSTENQVLFNLAVHIRAKHGKDKTPKSSNTNKK